MILFSSLYSHWLSPMFKSALLSFLLLPSLSACSGIGPSYSPEALRALYGPLNSSLLLAAADNGSLEHVKVLLQYHPSEQEIGDSFLKAAQGKHSDIVKFMLGKDSDLIYWQTGSGNNILDIAINNNDVETGLIAIKAGIDVNKPNANYLLDILENENTTIDNLDLAIELIKSGVDIDRETSFKRSLREVVGKTSAIHIAAYKSFYPIIDELIKRGDDVNKKDDENSTPLMWSISGSDDWKKGKEDISLKTFNLLIENGADIDAINDFGATSLHISVNHGRLDIVKRLIEEGSELNLRDNDGQTPLHMLILTVYENLEEYKLDIAKELIKAGVDLDLRNNNGYTPLHLSVITDEIDITKELLENGADIKRTVVNESNRLINGKDAYYIAIEKGNREMTELLREHGALD